MCLLSVRFYASLWGYKYGQRILPIFEGFLASLHRRGKQTRSKCDGIKQKALGALISICLKISVENHSPSQAKTSLLIFALLWPLNLAMGRSRKLGN